MEPPRESLPVRSLPNLVLTLLLGAVLPALCVFVDERSLDGMVTGFAHPLLELEIALCGTALVAWVVPRRAPSVFCGVLWAGALFAFVLGVVLLPLSVLGLVVILGVLGFVPFATAVVFFLEGLAARATAREFSWPAASLGFAVVFAVPALIHVSVRSAVAPHVERIVAGPEEDVAQAAAALARLGPLWRTNELVSLYEDHADRRVRARLSAAHHELTGRTIEETGLPWD